MSRQPLGSCLTPTSLPDTAAAPCQVLGILGLTQGHFGSTYRLQRHFRVCELAGTQ
jgi:hypothetical protein